MVQNCVARAHSRRVRKNHDACVARDVEKIGPRNGLALDDLKCNGIDEYATGVREFSRVAQRTVSST